MFDVLLESRAARQRRTGGTIASALVHGALIAAAVVLTMTNTVTGTKPRRDHVGTIFVAPPHRPAPHDGVRAPHAQHPDDAAPPRGPTITVDIVPPALPPIDAGTVVPDDIIRMGGPGTPIRTDAISLGGPGLGAGGEPVEEHVVDRVPRLIGTPVEPRYPLSLRSAGITGRVIAEFVIDTLGRVEMDDVRIPVASHELFAQAVRDVLPRYRFTVGEAAGRKVRTRVQMPFDFTITR